MPAGREPLYTSEAPVPHVRDARWLARRARNVARRPLVLLLFASAGFLVALLAIIAAPVGLRSIEQPPEREPIARTDTVSLVRAIEGARVRVEGATAALDDARSQALETRPTTVVVDTFPPEVRARRDSLAARARALAGAIRRATDAPLPASYRAIGELPEFTGDSIIRALLDSIAALELARGAPEAADAADTTFIALTARLAQLGDSVVRRAESRRAAIRVALGALMPEVRTVPAPNPVDTVPFVLALETSQRALAAADARLIAARAHNDSLRRVEARRAAADGERPMASPPLRILAAAVIGLAMGFLVALGGEVRRPAIGDAREAEVAAGVPVLAHAGGDPRTQARTRRRADRDVPPLIELTTDRYARLFHRLADTISRLPRIAVLGDHPSVVATVSANLAAAAAHAARSTLLLDTDFDSRSVATVMRVRPEPGVAEVLARRLHWSSAIIPAVVSRSRSIDVLPAGTMKGAASLAGAAEGFASEVTHIGSRYDTLVISAPLSRRGAVSAVAAVVPQAIVVVRVGRTPVRLLQRIVEDARRDGAGIRGLVVWDGEEPRLESLAAAETERTERATARV